MRILIPALVFVFLAGCSSSSGPAAKKAPEAPPEPVTGRQAFQGVYPPARTWAPDCETLQMRSIQLADVPQVNGKAAAWEVIFVSSSLSGMRSYTYSVVEAEGNLHQGAFAGPANSWSGPHGSQAPFPVQALKVDTDAAYATAAAKSQDYIKQNPNKPVNFILEHTPRFPDPTWRVMWGDSPATSDYSVYVDASTGEYLERVR